MFQLIIQKFLTKYKQEYAMIAVLTWHIGTNHIPIAITFLPFALLQRFQVDYSYYQTFWNLIFINLSVLIYWPFFDVCNQFPTIKAAMSLVHSGLQEEKSYSERRRTEEMTTKWIGLVKCIERAFHFFKFYLSGKQGNEMNFITFGVEVAVTFT